MFFWVSVFIISLFLLVKGADWLLDSAEKIGVHLGFSPFIIGALLTGIGTSLPELASGIAAVFQHQPTIVVANAVGSNIANILLVIGVSAVVGRKLLVTKNLIDLDLPLLATSTVVFLGVVYDGTITFIEGVMLVTAYLIYFAHSVLQRDTSVVIEQRGREVEERIGGYYHRFLYTFMRPFMVFKDYIFLVLGAIALFVGATYTIQSVTALSQIWGIATGVISITAIAFGTSLPELIVSIKSVLRQKYELAIGNVLGSNAFNALMVVGIPAIATTLPVDSQTLSIGVPAMALATFLFIISGISRIIHHWEGMMFMILYLFFVLKLFAVV